MSHYTEYYVRQAQTGGGMGYFAGSSSQRGHGLGSFLGGFFRTIVLPFLSRGAQTVGREALRAGSHVLADVASGETPIGDSAKRHFSEAGRNLVTRMADKMRGNGIKRKQPARGAQSKKITRPRRTPGVAKDKIHSIFARR